MTHLHLIFLNAFRNPMIQYSYWSMIFTYSHDELSPTEVVQLDVLLSILFDVCIVIQCFSQPFTRIVPSSFLKGDNLAIFNFWNFFAVCYRLWNIREAFDFSKSEQYFFLLVGFRLFWGVSSSTSWTSCIRQWSF